MLQDLGFDLGDVSDSSSDSKSSDDGSLDIDALLDGAASSNSPTSVASPTARPDLSITPAVAMAAPSLGSEIRVLVR